MCLAYSFRCFDLHYAEGCMCSDWHSNPVFIFTCWRGKVCLCSSLIWVEDMYVQDDFIKSQLVWPLLEQYAIAQAWCGNLKPPTLIMNFRNKKYLHITVSGFLNGERQVDVLLESLVKWCSLFVENNIIPKIIIPSRAFLYVIWDV